MSLQLLANEVYLDMLALCMQGQQEVNKVLSDVQTLQMKNQQELFTLLQSRLERVSSAVTDSYHSFTLP